MLSGTFEEFALCKSCHVESYIMNRISFILVLYAMFFLQARGQVLSDVGLPEKDNTKISVSERWSVRTNMFDWVTTVPNLSLEFDLSNSIYNRWAIGLGAKYNYIPSNVDFNSRIVYRTGDLRLEARRYFRGYQIFPYRNKRRPQRAWWRAYYVGPYVSASQYALQFNKPAFLGNALSLGLTAGFNIPLYETRHRGAVDLDLGLSAGAVYFDKRNPVTGISDGWRFLRYPMLTDLRVGLVYRLRSVRRKYIAVDEEKILRKHTERMLREKERMDKMNRDSLRQMR